MKILLNSIFILGLLVSCNENEVKLQEQINEAGFSKDSVVKYDAGRIEQIDYYEEDKLTHEKLFNNSGNHFQTNFYSDSIEGFSYEYYHGNGIVAETGTQGNFQGCGVPIGQTKKFDIDGNLLSIKTYEYFDEGSCHEMYIVTTLEKYERGELLEKGQFESGYQSGDCPCGKLITYHSNGTLTYFEYDDCYDSVLDCFE